jgi:protoporphyrinogen oxidase
MTMDGAPRIIIVGGGVNGLSAAWYLSRLLPPGSVRLQLVEADRSLGGLAGSMALGDLDVDRFYHFVLRPDRRYMEVLDELDLGRRLVWRTSRMAFFHQGRLVPFGTPLSLLLFPGMGLAHKLAYGFQVFRANLRRDWRDLEGQSAVGWLKRNFGERGYAAWWRQLMEMKFREHTPEVSAAWVWARIRRNARSRHRLLTERAGYLEGGTSVFIQALARALVQRGVEITTGRPVESLVLDAAGGGVRGIRAGGEETSASAVVFAAPLVLLAGLLDGPVPSDYGRRLGRLKNIGCTCTLIRLERRLTDSFWINFSDPRLPHAGIIEWTNLSREERFGQSSLIYIPEYGEFSAGDPAADPQRLLQRYQPVFSAVNPAFRTSWVKDLAVAGSPHAQPICGRHFSASLPPVRTPIPGLWAADSTHILPDDRTISASLSLGRLIAADVAEQLAAAGGGSEPWAGRWSEKLLWTREGF